MKAVLENHVVVLIPETAAEYREAFHFLKATQRVAQLQLAGMDPKWAGSFERQQLG